MSVAKARQHFLLKAMAMSMQMLIIAISFLFMHFDECICIYLPNAVKSLIW